MLPQSRTLEAADADNREGQDETVGGKGAIPKPVANIPEGRRFERSASRLKGQNNVSFKENGECRFLCSTNGRNL